MTDSSSRAGFVGHYIPVTSTTTGGRTRRRDSTYRGNSDSHFHRPVPYSGYTYTCDDDLLTSFSSFHSCHHRTGRMDLYGYLVDSPWRVTPLDVPTTYTSYLTTALPDSSTVTCSHSPTCHRFYWPFFLLPAYLLRTFPFVGDVVGLHHALLWHAPCARLLCGCMC